MQSTELLPIIRAYHVPAGTDASSNAMPARSNAGASASPHNLLPGAKSGRDSPRTSRNAGTTTLRVSTNLKTKRAELAIDSRKSARTPRAHRKQASDIAAPTATAAARVRAIAGSTLLASAARALMRSSVFITSSLDRYRPASSGFDAVRRPLRPQSDRVGPRPRAPNVRRC